jgi:uncharacterized membrane protein YidH (DUF202 family)
MNFRIELGFGNERTALAWQRTALSLLAGSAIVTRLTADRLGLVAGLSAAVCAPLAAWLFLESRGRYRHESRGRLRPRGRGGRAPFALAVATMVLGTVELAALLR